MAMIMCKYILLCSLCGFTVSIPPALTSDSFGAAPYPYSYELTPVDTIFKRDDNYTAPVPAVPEPVWHYPVPTGSNHDAPLPTVSDPAQPRVSNYTEAVTSEPDPVYGVPEHVYPESTLPEHEYPSPSVSNYTAPVFGVSNYTAPVPMGGGTDVGQYYYYYPVQTEAPPETKTQMTQMTGEHPLQTHAIIIIMLLVMILLQMTLPGLIASLAPLFPTIVMEGLTIPWPSGLLPTLALDPLTVAVPPLGPLGRDLSDAHLLSWENLNKLTLSVRSAIESDECLPRVVCNVARYADGNKDLLRILEVMPSEEYSSYVKMLKNSILGKEDCNLYKCGPLGPKD